MPRTQTAQSKPGGVSRALARDRLGVPAVLFFVLAGVAPLTVAAGVIPTAYATTGLTGIPAAFVVIAVILAIFATGYVAMARHITQRRRLLRVHLPRPGPHPRRGRRAGRAAGLFAACRSGCTARSARPPPAEAAAYLHVHAPWWAWALGAWAVITILGLLRVDITGRVLGVLLCAEIAGHHRRDRRSGWRTRRAGTSASPPCPRPR